MTDTVLSSALAVENDDPSVADDGSEHGSDRSLSSLFHKRAVSTGKSSVFACTDTVNAHSEYLGRFAQLISEGVDSEDEGMRRTLQFAQGHCQVCEEWLHTLRDLKLKKSVRYYQVYWEYRIWLLLSILFDGSAKNEPFSVDEYEHFYDDDRLVKSELSTMDECVVLDCLLEWLERTAPPIEYMKQGNVSYSRTRDMAPHLRHPSVRYGIDMDSYIRHDVEPWKLSNDEQRDVDNEDELLHTICRLIRRGRWKEIDEVCHNFGQPWRLASFAGRNLMSVSELNLPDRPSRLKLNGNNMYLIWLQSCRMLAENSKSERESWIYSALCGAPKTLVDDCQHWEDLLWSLMKCRKLNIVRNVLLNSAAKESGNWNSSVAQSFLSHKLCKDSGTDILDSEWTERLSSNESVFECVEYTLTIKDTLNREERAQSSSILWKAGTHALQRLSDVFLRNAAMDKEEYMRTTMLVMHQRRRKLELQYYKAVKCLAQCSFKRGKILVRSPQTMKALEHFIQDAESFVSVNSAEFIPFDYIRLVIHLFLSLSPPADPRGASSAPLMSLIERYIRGLAQSEQAGLASVYCTLLRNRTLNHDTSSDPSWLLVKCYAKFLGELKDGNQTVILLRQARDFGVFNPKEIASLAREVVDGSLLGPKLSIEGRERWEILHRPAKMDDSDIQRIKAVGLWLCSCLNESDQDDEDGEIQMSLEDTLMRVNVLFAEFARHYKERGCAELCRTINDEYHLSDEIEKHLKLQPYLRGHLNCLLSWQLFSEVTEWIETWDCYTRRCHSVSASGRDGTPLSSSSSVMIGDTGSVAVENETLQSLFECVNRFLSFPNGWLHPVYCPMEDLSVEEVGHLRGVLLFRVLYRVCRVANMTGHFDECLKWMDLLADERYDLYSSLNGDHLKTLLCVAQEADLKIITSVPD